MTNEWANKTAIVTGAGGSLGSTIVRALRDVGARVIAVDIRQEALTALQRQDPSIVGVVADVSASADAERVIVAAAGRVDALCNCAAIQGDHGLVDETTDATWAEVMRVNLTGPFVMCRAVLPVMLQNGGGAIVNVSSMSGLRGGRASPAYTASKYGLVGLTQNIAATYGEHGIRCNAICPGGMTPPMAAPGLTTERLRAFRARHRPVKPPPVPVERVAQLVVVLASEIARDVNGTALPVESGELTW